MVSKTSAMLVSAAVAAGSLFVAVEPASAALVTRCTGVAGAVTVPNDLVVPRGQACTLEGTTVQGNVRVAEGGDLVMEGAVVEGNLRVQTDGFVDIIGSTVGGSVNGRDHFGVFVEDSTVAGDVVQRAPEAETQPFFFTVGADLAGGVDARSTELLLESSTVGGDVSSRLGAFSDIIDTTIEGGLTVVNNPLGSVVCESEIYGPGLFERNGDTLQIGGSGAVSPCNGASFWGGDVTFTNNTAAVTGLDFSSNIVRGNLSGEGNDPAPTGQGNRVRGEVSGQFVDLQPAVDTAGADATAGQRSLAVTPSRADQLKAEIQQRRDGALSDAADTPTEQSLTLGNE